MPFSYKKLWIKLIEENIRKSDLLDIASISGNIMAKMGRNEPVSLQSLEKICLALNCDIGEIIEIVREGVPHEKID